MVMKTEREEKRERERLKNRSNKHTIQTLPHNAFIGDLENSCL